jgi:LL-H family phage holin
MDYLQPALEGLLYTVGTIIAGYLITLLHKWLGTTNMKKIQQEIETHQELAKLVVSAVQQIYTNLHGSEKLAQATKMLSDLLANKGIKLSADEIHMLIESTLKGLKQEFVDTWDSDTNADPQPTPNQPVEPLVQPDAQPITIK